MKIKPTHNTARGLGFKGDWGGGNYARHRRHTLIYDNRERVAMTPWS